MRCTCHRHETPQTAGMYMATFDPFGWPIPPSVTVRIRPAGDGVLVIASVGAFRVEALHPCVVEALFRLGLRYDGALQGAIHAEELRRHHFPQLVRTAA